MNDRPMPAPLRSAQVLAIPILLTGLVVSGCTGPLKQLGSEVSLISQAADFDAAQLRVHKVGVLHAVVGFGLEGYSLQVSRSLAKAVQSALPYVPLLPPHMAISLINGQEGLARQYTDMIVAYGQSGILDSHTLKQIGTALDAKYVLLPGMATFQQSISGRFSFFGLRLLQTRTSILRLTVQLWDTHTGRIVWESSGEATLAAEDVRELRIPFEEIADHLWRQLLANLGPAAATVETPDSK